MTIKEIYNKKYKLLLIIPALLLILSLAYLFMFYQENNDFIKKDVSLTGGTTISIYPEQEIDLADLKLYLEQNIEDFAVREITGLTTGAQESVIIESPVSSEELKQTLEDYLGYELSSDNSSIEFTGAFLSEAFYGQLIRAIIFAFILMAVVVFIIFRTAVPSLAVIISAFADIVMTLALVDLLGIRMASAGIVAFLMLIGYSVDTDIMLTSHLLRHKDSDAGSRLSSSLKTGLTMTLTSLVAVIIALLITSTFSEILRQIFLILTIGLCFDLVNTWLTNASLLKWHLERKNKPPQERDGEEK